MIVHNDIQFQMCLDDFRNARMVVVDTETTGLQPYQDDRLVSISLYFPHIDHSYQLPFRQGIHAPANIDRLLQSKWDKARRRELIHYLVDDITYTNLPIAYLEQLKTVWNAHEGLFIFHNAPFDLAFLAKEGFNEPDRYTDTMVMAYLVYQDWKGTDFWVNRNGKRYKSKGSRGLKWLAEFFKYPQAGMGEAQLDKALEQFANQLCAIAQKRHSENDPILTKLFKTFKPATFLKKVKLDKKSQLYLLDKQAVGIYAEEDVRMTWFLYERFLHILEQRNMLDVYERYNTFLKLIYEMEATGFYVDLETALSLKAEYQEKLRQYEQNICSILGDINLQSPKQLKAALELSGYAVESTSKDLLKKYPDDPLITDLVNYRKMQKAVTTYLDKWIENRDRNGFVHGHFDLGGTVSGRLASSGNAGNFQNIPERGAYHIKKCIVPPQHDWLVWSVDYGQLEARLAAWVAEDLLKLDPEKRMIRTFNEEADIHAYTRDLINVRRILYGDMSDEAIVEWLGYGQVDSPQKVVDKHCRFVAKTMNFGLLYGGGKRMLSALLDIEEYKAMQLSEQWHALFPAYRQAKQYCETLALSPRELGGQVHYYLKQPITNRYLLFTYYPKYYKVKNDDGEEEVINLQQYKASKSWNYLIQGCAGYLALDSYAMFRQQYPEARIQLFAQIHDALDGYIHKDDLHYLQYLGDCMTRYDTNPKLTVTFSIGKNWQEMKEIEHVERV